nr:unnamed protein product [Callosobruchus analis]
MFVAASSAASACASMASSTVTAATTSNGRHEHDESPCKAAVMGARHRRRCPPNPRDPPSRPPNSTPWCLVQAIATGFHRFLARFSGQYFNSWSQLI